MLTVGDKIKYFRKQRGMTQAQLAELTGIHPVSIRKYEINKNKFEKNGIFVLPIRKIAMKNKNQKDSYPSGFLA